MLLLFNGSLGRLLNTIEFDIVDRKVIEPKVGELIVVPSHMT